MHNMHTIYSTEYAPIESDGNNNSDAKMPLNGVYIVWTRVYTRQQQDNTTHCMQSHDININN